MYAMTRLPIPFLSRCRVPWELDEVLTIGEEIAPSELRLDPEAVAGVWNAVEGIYHSGVHPAIQLCIRRGGRVVLHRALGHASGNAPDDPVDGPKTVVGLDTPIDIF